MFHFEGKGERWESGDTGDRGEGEEGEVILNSQFSIPELATSH
jgi:hypothetical protein